MNQLGNKIKEVRKKKGLSQEELAESAKVNLRTIQRIENNENEPRGKTLHLICEVLDLNTEDVLDYGMHTDKNYLIFFQLSVLTGVFMPLGNIIIPFILWSTKKDKVIGLNKMGINLLNFQITWTFFTFFSIIFGVFMKIIHFEIGPFTGNMTMILPLIFFYPLNIILPIIFALKVRNERMKRFYPNIIKLIK
ncbi:helix-turn-helix domain-containing protein [Algibacter sp. AS12]|uniref:DUF4870 domain-containing protein n=1 Tax=Algibacter sp. AS12 TaxID=3135773 RepID=UPI00398BABB5